MDARPTHHSRPGRSGAAADVVVVGGGIIGLAIAWKASEHGLTVTVVDPEPRSGASRVAAGMLAPVTEVHYGEEDLLALNLASARRWLSFADELEEASGLDVGYRPHGTLAVALDADDNVALEDLFRYQLELGLEVERLTGRDCRRPEPLRSPRVRGGGIVPGDHQVDPRAVVAALRRVLDERGVELVADTATGVLVEGDRVTGVLVGDGAVVRAGQVVLAAGCRSGSLPGLPPGAVPPVRPVKGQLLIVRQPERLPLLRRNIRGTVEGSFVYLVPRNDGRIVIGATAEEQGFDQRVTAGAVHDLLRDAVELVPGIAEAELVETCAGLRPGTPDNAPLLGRAALPGLVVATGHYRNGILLTPVTADAVAELLADGTVAPEIAPFSPARFAPEPSPV